MQTVLHGIQTQLAIPDKLKPLGDGGDKNRRHVKHAVCKFGCGGGGGEVISCDFLFGDNDKITEHIFTSGRESLTLLPNGRCQTGHHLFLSVK